MKQRKTLSRGLANLLTLLHRQGRKIGLKEPRSRRYNGIKDKQQAQGLNSKKGDRASSVHMQEKLYRTSSSALLLIFQAMDAARKRWRHFKARDVRRKPAGLRRLSSSRRAGGNGPPIILWRITSPIRARGKKASSIALIREEFLSCASSDFFERAQKLPDDLITKHSWDEVYEDINSFERYLTRQRAL